MHSSPRLATAFLTLVLAPGMALAQNDNVKISTDPHQWDIDLRAGVYADDVDGPMVGFGALTQWGNTHWYFNPNIEAAFGDTLDMITLNADVHYDFRRLNSARVGFWAGFGAAVVHYDPDIGDTDFDPGVNLLVGLGANRGKVRPFGQIKVLISDETELVVMGGVRF